MFNKVVVVYAFILKSNRVGIRIKVFIKPPMDDVLCEPAIRRCAEYRAAIKECYSYN